MKVNWERIMFGLPTLIMAFVLILLDAFGIINIEKFGYAAVGGWIALLINFYYRKDKKEDSTNEPR